jgi:hypothetical protein
LKQRPHNPSNAKRLTSGFIGKICQPWNSLGLLKAWLNQRLGFSWSLGSPFNTGRARKLLSLSSRATNHKHDGQNTSANLRPAAKPVLPFKNTRLRNFSQLCFISNVGLAKLFLTPAINME